ncbi:hypothetical protein D6E03_09430, partial [Moraxella catarrhalis]|uniref:hypothetical protein n=1 Tax=Moraxella catarrhalis TaxID=480 RepID=UPI000ED7D6DC
SAGTQLTQDVLTQAEGLLTQAGLNHHNGRFENNSALLRLSNAKTLCASQSNISTHISRGF